MSGIRKDALIIGGGFFGLYIAEYLSERGMSVLVCEKEHDLMQRASYANQARVHNGYHYPRSILTALRSRMSAPRFLNEFSDCTDSTFEKYYAIGTVLGKISANQFRLFCERINAPCDDAPRSVRELFSARFVEAVFATQECAFNAVLLKKAMVKRLVSCDVDIRTQTLVKSVQPSRSNRIAAAICNADGDSETVLAKHVFNCTYSQINQVLTDSSLNVIPLKHEMTEMALVEVPEVLRSKGITIMCGPFFSIMPFPVRDLHSFSHVRYTPHYEWLDGQRESYMNSHEHFAAVEKRSAWFHMMRDARRYLPIVEECQYRDSIWEVKTVLPRSEYDDSRPILTKFNYIIPNFHCILGGKIDNVYDAVGAISEQLFCEEAE